MSDAAGRKAGEDWWTTSIIEMHSWGNQPAWTSARAVDRADQFPAMIWLMLRGTLHSVADADLLGAALSASLDHGP
jgi:citrate synthase